MFLNQCPLSWRSARQQLVTLSTTESELTEAVDGTVLSLSCRGLISELLGVTPKIVIHRDNQSALALVHGQAGSWRTRHLRLRVHWLREKIMNGEVQVVYEPGTTQRADLGTKPFTRERLRQLVECEMLVLPPRFCQHPWRCRRLHLRTSRMFQRVKSMDSVCSSTPRVSEQLTPTTVDVGTQTAEPAFSSWRTSGIPVPRIEMRAVIPEGPYYHVPGRTHVRLVRRCWGLRNARAISEMTMRRCCRENDGRSMYGALQLGV